MHLFPKKEATRLRLVEKLEVGSPVYILKYLEVSLRRMHPFPTVKPKTG